MLLVLLYNAKKFLNLQTLKAPVKIGPHPHTHISSHRKSAMIVEIIIIKYISLYLIFESDINVLELLLFDFYFYFLGKCGYIDVAPIRYKIENVKYKSIVSYFIIISITINFYAFE